MLSWLTQDDRPREKEDYNIVFETMLYRYKQKSYVVWSKQEEEDRAVHVLYITVDYCRLHEKWTSRETQTDNIVCYTVL